MQNTELLQVSNVSYTITTILSFILILWDAWLNELCHNLAYVMLSYEGNYFNSF